MSPKTAAEPVESGRGRLQRESVVQTALTLMNEIGLDDLSLRRLAEKLHVQAPALYWHFKNKQELLDQMAESLILSSYPPDMNAINAMEWSDFLLLMGRTMRRALQSYRDGARLLASADVTRNSLASVNAALGVMSKAGFSNQQALVGIMTVVHYTLGYTFQEQSALKRDNELEHLHDMVVNSDYNYLKAAFGENLVPLDPEAEFEASLGVIIDGMRGRRAKSE